MYVCYIGECIEMVMFMLVFEIPRVVKWSCWWWVNATTTTRSMRSWGVWELEQPVDIVAQCL